MAKENQENPEVAAGKPQGKPEGGKKDGGKKEGGKKESAKADAGKKDGGKKGKEAPAESKEPLVTPRLQVRYHKEIVPAMIEKFGRKNILSLPRLKKIVVNMGVGAASTEKKYLEEATDAMKLIAGQKPVITKARQSIAGFKLREGMPIGCKVTLRGRRMYEFLDRLVALALPRVRDFRGLPPNAFDGNGNYSIGLTEQLVFPELNPDKYTRTQGMNITLVTNGGNDDEAREMLRLFGVPLRAPEAPAAKGKK